jgi:serine/threonine protein kinase
MELLDRGSLDDRITKLGQLPEADVLSIGIQLASALRAAWRHGLLHRDVKPGNVLFNDEDVPKIVDFGLARYDKGDSGQTRVWGTPYYVAPEKLRDQPEDFRSDIYSLGATLFHALAGQPPFDAATAGEVVTKHATQPAYSLNMYAPSVHERTTRVISRMLAKDPAKRHQSYDELIRDLIKAQESLRQKPARKWF